MARRKIYCLFSGIYKYTCTSEVLKEKFEPVLKEPGVVGLSIGTRPDCLPDDVVEYLADLNQRTYLWVELGLQTIHQSTSDLINRAHDMQTYYDGVAKLRKHNINVCTHIINGLPGEDYDMMMLLPKKLHKWMYKVLKFIYFIC